MNRKIAVFFMIVALLIACAHTAAAEAFDPNQLGCILVTLADKKTPISGAELSVYYVATVTMDGEGDLVYDYTKEFASIGTPLQDTSLAAALDVFVSQHAIPSQKIVTDSVGSAVCDQLPLGLYFVTQTGGVEGFAPCAPFLVTVPAEENGEYVYEVNATPKTETQQLMDITIKKLWNTDASTAATDQVTVQLLKNGTVMKTAILNEQNNWQITYTNMPKSDAYTIKEVNIPKGFTATYGQEGAVFTVTNSATLIQTGQLIWPIPVLAISGLFLLLVGIVLLQKKRRKNA